MHMEMCARARIKCYLSVRKISSVSVTSILVYKMLT